MEDDYVSCYKVEMEPVWTVNLQRKRNHGNFIQLSYSIATLSIKFFYDEKDEITSAFNASSLEFLTWLNLEDGTFQNF